MRVLPLHTPAPHRYVWLLCLALPLAQLLAAWHGLSHRDRAPAALAEGKQAPKQAPGAAHCDLCIVVAAVGAGAMAARPPWFAISKTRHAVPPSAAGAAWLPPPARPYDSRAPPRRLR